MRQLTYFLFAALFAVVTSCHSADSSNSPVEGGTAPPNALLQENWQKAAAVVEGKIVGVKDGVNTYSSARLLVTKVYKGASSVGDTLTYLSFREEKYAPAVVGQEYAVFLTKQEEEGRAFWTTATDLAEFPANAATKAAIQSITR